MLAVDDKVLTETSSAIDISIDPFTGRNPSYCFVEFDEKARADQAMQELNGLMFMGRPLKIKPCVAKTSRQNDGWEKSSDFVFDRWTRTDASSHYRGYSGQGRRLRVSGLPKPSTQVYMNQKLREFFKDFVVYVASYSPATASSYPWYASCRILLTTATAKP
jgi:RNA recognition motif-containing protein